MKRRDWIKGTLAIGALALGSALGPWQADQAKGQAMSPLGQAMSPLDPENTLLITVGLDYPSEDASAQPARTGVVTIKLLPELAPGHVARIKELARSEFYDGVVFHRVIEDFMAQTGDPRGNGTGGSSLPDLPAEFSTAEFRRGTVGMARSQNPNSANSQFFIMFERAASLDGNYTVFGEVVDGMSVVDEIKRGPRSRNGQVSEPRDRIVTVRVAADL